MARHASQTTGASVGPGGAPSPPRPGLLLVISGPSGVGKTSIVRAVRSMLDAHFSVSATTRPRTGQDTPGIDYDFVDEATFDRMIRDGRFIEYAKVFGRAWYGTPRDPVEQALRAGRTVILDIDVQGALQVRSAMPHAFLVFVSPPSDEELYRRLRARGRDDDEAIARRFAEARREIETAHASAAYDAFIVNDDLDRAIREVCALAQARIDARR
ncbi:MAG: guanylate kinase [Phycisphaeraceae bacterium]|nr:guanylate kinase [Phycisphaeraceae bacterium]